MTTGTVVEGKVVVEGDPLPEGLTVIVFYQVQGPPFELTAEQLALLDESIAQADRGELIPAHIFIEELRARTRRVVGEDSQ